MGTIVNLTESDLYRIVKRVIKESYSEEHPKYTNPKTGDECEIKMAKKLNKPVKLHSVIADKFLDNPALTNL